MTHHFTGYVAASSSSQVNSNFKRHEIRTPPATISFEASMAITLRVVGCE
jgi:uncharacterized protein (UPF0218 family)